MKTELPLHITSKTEAVAFLTALHNNGEAFHPEDDATDIDIFTEEEGRRLNDLMSDMYELPDFDPCEVLVTLSNAE